MRASYSWLRRVLGKSIAIPAGLCRQVDRRVRFAAFEVLEQRSLFSTSFYSYTGPGDSALAGVTKNWYTWPENVDSTGNTVRGPDANAGRSILVSGLPSHQGVTIEFDLKTYNTYSGASFKVELRETGPAPSYSPIYTELYSSSLSNAGSVTTQRIVLSNLPKLVAHTDDRIWLQFTVTGVPTIPAAWAIDNLNISGGPIEINDCGCPNPAAGATGAMSSSQNQFSSSLSLSMSCRPRDAPRALAALERIPIPTPRAASASIPIAGATRPSKRFRMATRTSRTRTQTSSRS
jgi:hypothetical protein